MFYTLPRAIKEEKKNEERVGSLESKERARFGTLKREEKKVRSKKDRKRDLERQKKKKKREKSLKVEKCDLFFFVFLIPFLRVKFFIM